MYEVPDFLKAIYWASVFFLTLFVFYLTVILEAPLYLWLVPVALAVLGAWAVRPLWCAGGISLLAFAALALKVFTDF